MPRGPKRSRVPADDPNRKRLDRTAEAWIAETTVRKSSRTGYIYGKTIQSFQASTSKVFLDEITREDITAFLGFLQRKGNGDRTVFNAASYLRSFFRWVDLPEMIQGRDLPRYIEKVVSAYSVEEVRAMLTIANAEERLFLTFMVGTGLREQEAMYLYFTDIDFDRCILTVSKKPEYNFKDREERSIPISDALCGALKARHKGTLHSG